MEYPKAFNRLTIVYHGNQGGCNGLDERLQARFVKGPFLASKMDSFFGDGVGGLACITCIVIVDVFHGSFVQALGPESFQL